MADMGKDARDLIEKSILMTVGAAALTAEKAQQVIGEMVEKGKVSTDESRTMFDELMEKARKEGSEVKGRFDKGVQRSLRDMGIAIQDDVTELKLKIEEFERRLDAVERVQATSEVPLAEPPLDTE